MNRPFHVGHLLATACSLLTLRLLDSGQPVACRNKIASLFQVCVSEGLGEYFPTDRPSAPAQQREGVPDRPTLSASGHAAQPDSGDPTDRLSPAPLATAWLGQTPRPTDPLRSLPWTQSILSTSCRRRAMSLKSSPSLVSRSVSWHGDPSATAACLSENSVVDTPLE